MAKSTEQLLQELIDISKSKSSNGGASYSGGLTGAVGKINAVSDNSRDKELSFFNLRLKFNKEYQKILKDINDKEKLALKMQDEHEKFLLKKSQYDKAQLEYVRKAEELEKLKLNTQKLSGAEKKKNQKYILDEEKVLNRIIEQNKDVLEELEKQVEVEKELKDIEHDLGKLNRDKNEITKKTGKSTEVIKKASESLLDIGSKILMNALNQDSAMSKLSANYALSKSESGQLKLNIGAINAQTTLLGVNTEDLVKMQSSYTDSIGRSVLLTKDGMVAMAETAVATGLGVEGVANMAAEFENFNIGVVDSTKNIEQLMIGAKKAGVSSSVASKNFNENLKLANTYNFKDGVEGVRRMTIYSTQMKFTLADVAKIADKVSNPEGALETAASLQVLGGSFANMSDPITLLNQGVTDMEGLSKTYIKMLEGIVTVDKTTGEAIENGYDKIRMKAAATALGVNFDDAMTTARNLAKRKVIESQMQITPKIKGLSKENQDLITTLATKQNGQWGVNIKGKQTALVELSDKDIEALQPKDVQMLDVAQNTLGTMDLIKNSVEAMLTQVAGYVVPALNTISEYIAKIANLIFGKTNNDGKPNPTYGTESMKGTAGSMGVSAAAGGIGKYLLKNGLMGAAIKTMAGGAGLSGLVSAGFDLAEGNGIKHAAGVGAGSAIGSGIGGSIGGFLSTFTGGAAAPILIPLGMAAGSVIGESIARGLMNASEKANDLIIPKGGKPILLNDNDNVFAMKPGGAILNAIAPRANTRAEFNGPTPPSQLYSYQDNGGKIYHDFSGSIRLEMTGGGSSKIDASELIKNQQFVKEFTRIISNQNSRNKNGGKFSGSFGSDSI